MDGDISPTSVTCSTASSFPVVLNGAEVALGSMTGIGSLAGDQDKGDISVSLSSSLIHDNAVLVETPRGLLLSVGDGVGNVAYGNITTAADPEGRQLLPLPVTLFTHCQQEGLVGGQNSHVFEVQAEGDAVNVCANALEGTDSGCTSQLPLTPVTTTVTTTDTDHGVTKKRKGGWPKGKKRKNTPEVNAPRAPMTGYVLYAIERRQEIKESNPEIMFADVTKILGQEWSSMLQEKKQKYLEEAEADKRRYIDELKAFQQSEAYQNYVKKRKLKGLYGEDPGTMDTGDTYTSLIDLEEDCINELYCRVCNQYFSSLHNKKEHMFGRQHLQAITGELEKELQHQHQHQHQQQSMTTTSLIATDINTDSIASLSDNELGDIPRTSLPVDIESFIQDFIQKNIERTQEIKMLRRALKTAQEENIANCKTIQDLKEYETKLEQNVKHLKAYSTSLSVQIDGLKMVPTLFGVINF